MIVFFFFFKQKTAYEMRISDWSSDVCSSDLLLAGAPAALPALSAEAATVLVYTSGTTGAPKDFTLSSANIHANVAGLVAEGLVEIGRASCRERVCQYV